MSFTSVFRRCLQDDRLHPGDKGNLLETPVTFQLASLRHVNLEGNLFRVKRVESAEEGNSSRQHVQHSAAVAAAPSASVSAKLADIPLKQQQQQNQNRSLSATKMTTTEITEISPKSRQLREENKSPAKRIKRSWDYGFDEIGLICGFINEGDKPGKCLPNSDNLARLYEKSDELINKQKSSSRKSAPRFSHSQKKNSSGVRLDSANVMICEDIPLSYLEETLQLSASTSSSSSSRRSGAPSSAPSVSSPSKRSKVSLVKRKTSLLEDYSSSPTDSSNTVNTPEKPPPPSSSQPSLSSNPSTPEDHCNLVSPVTPPLTPERQPQMAFSSQSSFRSSRGSEESGGQLHLSSLEGLSLPECNVHRNSNRVASPLSSTLLFSLSPSTPPPLLVRSGRSGSSARISAQSPMSPPGVTTSTASNTTPKRPTSFLSSSQPSSPSSASFIRRRQSSATSSSTTSSSSAASSLSPSSKSTTTTTTANTSSTPRSTAVRREGLRRSSSVTTSRTNGHGWQ